MPPEIVVYCPAGQFEASAQSLESTGGNLVLSLGAIIIIAQAVALWVYRHQAHSLLPWSEALCFSVVVIGLFGLMARMLGMWED